MFQRARTGSATCRGGKRRVGLVSQRHSEPSAPIRVQAVLMLQIFAGSSLSEFDERNLENSLNAKGNGGFGVTRRLQCGFLKGTAPVVALVEGHA